MQKNLFVAILVLFVNIQITSFAQNNYEVSSPDINISVIIDVGEIIQYSVIFNHNEVIHPSAISMNFDNGNKFGINAKVKKTSVREIDETIVPVVKEKREEVNNHCNELTIEFKGNYSLIFRTYNDGVAYRWRA